MEFIKYIAYALVTIVELGGIVTGFVLWLKARRDKVKAQTEAEVAKAEADEANAKIAIQAEARRLIGNAETELKDLHEFLKTRQGTAGGLKFENTANALKIFCLKNGYNYEDADLESEIKEAVAFTKTVNVTTTK